MCKLIILFTVLFHLIGLHRLCADNGQITNRVPNLEFGVGEKMIGYLLDRDIPSLENYTNQNPEEVKNGIVRVLSVVGDIDEVERPLEINFADKTTVDTVFRLAARKFSEDAEVVESIVDILSKDKTQNVFYDSKMMLFICSAYYGSLTEGALLNTLMNQEFFDEKDVSSVKFGIKARTEGKHLLEGDKVLVSSVLEKLDKRSLELMKSEEVKQSKVNDVEEKENIPRSVDYKASERGNNEIDSSIENTTKKRSDKPRGSSSTKAYSNGIIAILFIIIVALSVILIKKK